jgi:diguanylate cyclase (GGDEF)-like protein
MITREIMAAFISTQLDFILFFYGLAFILLGATCIAIARIGERPEYWAVLAFFGFLHGASEWLDLTALVISDTLEFAIARCTLMMISFVLLMEFARLEAIRFGFKAPGRWLYAPLLLLVVLGGAFDGVTAAGSVARYTIGFTGALATSAIFVGFAGKLSGGTRALAICAALGFALYAVAAGAIVPTSSFWPASVLNHDWFARVTGIPIQLVRGMLACWIAFSIWAIWGEQLIAEVSSTRYTQFLRRQFVWTLIAMAAILLGGWTLTEFLGGIYKENVQQAARGDLDLLASRLAGETATVEGMVKSLAGSPTVLSFLAGDSRQDAGRAKSVLDLDVDAAGAEAGYILDRSGKIVISSTRRGNAPVITPDYIASAYFKKAVDGEGGYYFAYDSETGDRDYYASYPVRVGDSRIVGVAVLKKSLEAFEADLSRFDHAYFFVDPDGVVVMTNRPHMMLRNLWPLSAQKQSALSLRFGSRDDRPVLQNEIADATWISFGGERDYVRRRFANHSQWSLVILNPIREIYASRVLGIVITLLVAIMTLIYLFGRERWFHDNVQMEGRLQLQQLARDLHFQAITDPLTGLYNRLKFDEALVGEISRSARYKTPLALVLYDVDRFKSINDTYGHQLGDNVLIELSKLVAGNIRSIDVLARWGGEEFAIMFPGSDGEMASQAAEKLRAAIEQIAIDGIETVTCSFGIAEYADSDTALSLIARADRALYRAKVNGRNRVELAASSAESESGLASVA